MSTTPIPTRTIAVLTSGGDAPGMNAAVRAVVRTALARGARSSPSARATRARSPAATASSPMTWSSVGGILHHGRHRHRHRALGPLPLARGPAAGGGELPEGRHRQPGGDRRRRQPHRRRPAAAGVAGARRGARRLRRRGRRRPRRRRGPSASWASPARSTTTWRAPTSRSAPTRRCTGSPRRSTRSPPPPPATSARSWSRSWAATAATSR